jgi:hypothetical protein
MLPSLMNAEWLNSAEKLCKFLYSEEINHSANSVTFGNVELITPNAQYLPFLALLM